MAEARQRSDWDKVSWLGAIIINAQRTKGDKFVTPAQINPYLADRQKPAPKSKDVGALAAAFGITGPPADARPAPGPLTLAAREQERREQEQREQETSEQPAEPDEE